MLEENVEKICVIINQYYREYGEPIKDWAIRTGFETITTLAANLEFEFINVKEILKHLQDAIRNLVVEIYKDKTQRPGTVYDKVINQLGWKIPPKKKKKTIFYQFLKNNAPNIEYSWAKIENDFRRILENNITNKKSNLISNVQKLNLETKILNSLKKYFSEELYKFIHDNTSYYKEKEYKIYASDIVNIIKISEELNIYIAIKEMIANERIPDWLICFWHNEGIALKNGYDSECFKQVNLQYNCITEIHEKKCIKTIKNFYEAPPNYKHWINLAEKMDVVPNNIAKIDANYLDWDIIYDNILYFVDISKPPLDLKIKTFQNSAKEYLKPLLSILRQEKNDERPTLEIKKDFCGYYCAILYKPSSQKFDNHADYLRYNQQNTIITPFLSSLFEYILFPSIGRYNRFVSAWNAAKTSFGNIEVKSEIDEKYNDFSLSNICVRKEYKTKFNAYLSDESETKKPVFIYDISKFLLNEFENKRDFSENYKAEICRVYNFGNRKKNAIHGKYNELFTKTNISTIDKLRILFMFLDEFPTTINNTFRYEFLSEKDYKELIGTGNNDVQVFIDRVYEKCGKDSQGRIVRKMIDDDYKPNGRYFSQTIKYLKLPASFLEKEKAYDIFGPFGCSEILDNCEHLLNYALAMQYNPLISKDKKEERIFELICCYPEIYNRFVNS